MRVGIFGATGFIGGELARTLSVRGDEVVGFSRRAKGVNWRSSEGPLDLRGLDALVNLAGASVASRWTEARKQEMRQSRIGLTERIVATLRTLPEDERPRAFLNGSAIGYYGNGGEEVLTEEREPSADFLAQLCVDWENAALEAGGLGVRVVLLRTGIVLGHGGEAWEKMSRVFRLGLGGRLGSGKQWMPWVHLRDEVGGIVHLLDHEQATGPVNLVAPEPVRNATWTKELARAFGRPAFFHAPGFALKAILGGFGATLLASSRVEPARMREWGYSFAYPDLSRALRDLTKDGR